MKLINWVTFFVVIGIGILSACGSKNPSQDTSGKTLNILAAESFLADIAQNVVGDRAIVETLIPLGLDPHTFEATPKDAAKIENADILILNGGGLEYWLDPLLSNTPTTSVIIASSGIEPVYRESGDTVNDDHEEGDPHFWLNPVLVINYVNNIRDGLISVDPGGKAIYEKNAADYIKQLEQLDSWIMEQITLIPVEKRILVTNHESLGYFSDRYGFKVAGAIIPSTSSGATPSALELASLVEIIKKEGVRAIFLETGANPALANQIASETGIGVVTDIYTHSLTPPDGVAPTYIKMMKHNTLRIVETLKSGTK